MPQHQNICGFPITEQIEHLGVHDRHDKIEGIIRVGNDDEQCCLTISEGVQFQFVVAHQLPQLCNVKGSKSCATGNKDRFCCFARDELSRTFSSSSRRSYILLDFLSEHTLDFVLHRLFCGLAEMDTHDIGGLTYLLSDSRARDVRGVAGRCIVHSKSSCKMKNARRFHRAVVLWGKKARRQL